MPIANEQGDKVKKINLDFSQNEVVLALAKPTGTNLENFRNRLEEGFEKVQTSVVFIDLVDVLDVLNKRNSLIKLEVLEKVDKTPDSIGKNLEYLKISKKMTLGSRLREAICPEFFSLYAMYSIHNHRTLVHSKTNKTKSQIKNTVYVLDCLKNPYEEKILRKVYGDTFFLLGINSSRNSRLKNMVSQKGMSVLEATKLIERDENEKEYEFGQKLLSVFEKSDYFFDESATQDEIDRFIEIILGNSKITPHKDEYFMQLASSVAAMSGDLSRQVGAVLVSDDGELLSVGYNEVPKYGGGQYAAGDLPDFRDLVLGYDPNHKNREIIQKGIKAAAMIPFNKKNLTMKEKKLKEEVESQLQLPMDKIKNLIEYHRTVHAEMEAITSCSRKGLKTKNSILYTTTYPCHNCAKHLVSAGVRKIIYIESYPKSLATDLHRDSIGPIEDTIQKMNIVGFQGVSPRRYLDFFSQTLSPGLIMERKGEGNFDKKPWNVSKFPPKEYDFKFSYRLNNLRALEAQTVTFLNPLLISQSKLVRYQRKKNKNSSAA